MTYGLDSLHDTDRQDADGDHYQKTNVDEPKCPAYEAVIPVTLRIQASEDKENQPNPQDTIYAEERSMTVYSSGIKPLDIIESDRWIDGKTEDTSS